MSPSPSRLRARSVDAQRSPRPTSRASAWELRKMEPVETTAHPLKKPCLSRSSSPAWEFSGLRRSSLDPPVGPLRPLRPPAQGSGSPDRSMVRGRVREATALHQKKLCPSSLTSLRTEAAAHLSCRSQTLLQAVHVQGSPKLPRSPDPSALKMLASEEDTALPLRRLCHLSLMEGHLGTTAHPPGSPELSQKSMVTASSRLPRSRVRSASLPPQTRLLCGSQTPSAAHPARLSDLLTSPATAPGWRSPDPGSRLVDPPLGSTTLLSTWTAPQSRKMARPSRSREPQIRGSEQRDPQSREPQPRWKEAQRPPVRSKEMSPLRGTDPLPPGQPLLRQQILAPGQPLPRQQILPLPEPLSPQPIQPSPGQPRRPQSIPTPGQSLLRQRFLTPPGQPEPTQTPEESLPPEPILTPGEPQSLQPIQPLPGQSLLPQPILAPGRPAPRQPILRSGESRSNQQYGQPSPAEPILLSDPSLRLPSPGHPLRPGQPLSPEQHPSPGQPRSPRSPGPAAVSISSGPPAPRFRLLTRLLRGLLGRPPGGANWNAAAATSATKHRGRSTTPPAMSPRTGPPDASSGFSAEIAAAESRSATYSATSSPKPSGAASADVGVPSPEARAPPRSRRTMWLTSADRCAKKPLRCAPRRAQRRHAASSSTSNSRRRRWATCARTACCF
uniref:Guanine nucleotide-binding protein G(s) subunit alpha n=1 Tax=Chinchilla lanigera TaxID=34839 RepID=A0A8C2V986_CHILA